MRIEGTGREEAPGGTTSATMRSLSRRVTDRHISAAVRPAAAQRHTQTQAQIVRRLRGEAHHVEKIFREKRQIAKSLLRIVELERIDRLHLHAADAARLHGAQLTGQLALLHRGAEPPPAHHGPRIHGRRGKAAANRGEGIGRAPVRRCGLLRCGRQCPENERKSSAGNYTNRAMSPEKAHVEPPEESPPWPRPLLKPRCCRAEPPRRSIVIPQDTNGKQNVERNLQPEEGTNSCRIATNRGQIRTGAFRDGAVDRWRRVVVC